MIEYCVCQLYDNIAVISKICIVIIRSRMIMLKLLFNAVLIFTVAAVSLVPNSENYQITENNYRLPKGITPQSYDINIIINKFTYKLKKNFDGESNTTIFVHYPTRNISLHAHRLKIDQVATKLVNVYNSTIYRPQEHRYNKKTQILNLAFNHDITPGVYSLNMKFAGFLRNNVKRLLADKLFTGTRQRWIFATSFHPIGTRQIFPCWDEPGLKATFNISIKHFPNYITLSAMPKREKREGEEGKGDAIILDSIYNNTNFESDMVWTHFEITPVISTHVVGIAISDFYHSNIRYVVADIWCTPLKMHVPEYMHNITGIMKEFMTSYVNSSVKAPKKHQIMITETKFTTIVNGILIYETHFHDRDKKFNRVCGKDDISMLIAHEVAHQWFGNLITPSWWTHVWLSEGLASFFHYYIRSKIFSHWRVMDYFVVHSQQMLLRNEALSEMKPITYEVTTPKEIKKLFSTVSYKATSIIRMLQHVITEEVFQKGINIYINRHKFKSVTPDDFWSAMQDALNESDIQHKNYSLKEVMDTWLTQSKYPVLTITRNYTTGDAIIKQQLVGYKNYTGVKNNITWWTPVTYTIQSNPDFSNTSPKVWLKPHDHNVSITNIDKNDWIIVNLQQIGYYRVNYDLTNWRQIAKYLNCEEYTKIHVLNRAQLIDDVYYFLMQKEFDGIGDTFLEITSYLKRETDYVPWYPMFRFITEISHLLKYQSISFLKLHLLDILKGLLKNIGYEEDLNDDEATKNLRLLAAKWACELDSDDCKEIANDKLRNHLREPKTYKILPRWKEWTYCMGMRKASENMRLEMMDKYAQSGKKHKNILKYLTCIEHPKKIISYLDMITSHNFSDIERTQIYSEIIKKHASKTSIYDYIIENFYKLLPSGMSVVNTLRQLIRSVFPTITPSKNKKLTKLIDEANLSKKDKKLINDTFNEAFEVRREVISFFFAFSHNVTNINTKEKNVSTTPLVSCEYKLYKHYT